MITNRQRLLGGILLLLLALVALVARVPQTAANVPQGEISAYLPFIAAQPRPPMGIYGRVTENTIPAPGITLDLRFFNGSDWSTAASTTTNANGEYNFFDMPGLAPGQIYYVRYFNHEDNTNRIGGWYGFIHTTYTTGADALGGDMDIGGLHLLSPGNEGIVGVPVNFSWNLRPTPESYEFNLFDPSGDPYFFTDPPLGYVNNYTLNGLPAGFDYYIWYLWALYVYGPGGSFDIGNYGFSYWANWVGFVETAEGPELVTLPNTPVRNPVLISPEMER